MSNEAVVDTLTLALEIYKDRLAKTDYVFMCAIVDQLYGLGLITEEDSVRTKQLINTRLEYAPTLSGFLNQYNIPITKENKIKFWEDLIEELSQ